MLNFVERTSDFFGRLAAWMFFIIGGMLTYEVIARNALYPTIWAEEMARFFQIWATYLAAAYVLRHGQLIRISLLTERFGPRMRQYSEVFSLLVMAAFCLIAIGYGIAIAYDSVLLGRNTSTMLGVPKVLTEAAIPVGFTLLLLQILVQLTRLLRGEAPAEPQAGEDA